jgi:TonB family protein
MFIRPRQTILWAALLLVTYAFVSPPKSAAQKKEKSDRKLVKKVDPAYPSIASQYHLSGSVKMVLQVTGEGKVESVQTTGGSPILAAAAENAAKQWKYEAAAKGSSEVVTITFEATK